jgi:hypothetical protein
MLAPYEHWDTHNSSRKANLKPNLKVRSEGVATIFFACFIDYVIVTHAQKAASVSRMRSLFSFHMSSMQGHKGQMVNA